ncbi:B-cell receptor CD22-like isoform X7 [Dicentrarchus labrax]|uniref:B-cell receptor CD22-like isoform X7 n=1 Tax=Dicentrarchus labrax TaxID=13489 RepID=UPI0021F56CBA|nr:B-cell receptor CD22-like isoform X7 [Dicentrarchus labrax]
MDSLKWTLFLVYLNIHVIQTDSSPWTIKVPSSVKGLPGSCVVIPCSFNFPNPSGKTLTGFTGMWTDATNQIFYHPDKSKVMKQYQNRAELIGDVGQKNCSLKIDPLQQSDTGPFHFRIEIQNLDKYSYRENTVSITMMSELNPIHFSVKEEVVEGQTEFASCSVSHSCPSSPPVFTWNHSGEALFQEQQLENGQWKAKSNLTFHPTRADHNKPLQCTVRYKGGQEHETSKVLKVKYAPVNVRVEHESAVKEGETVQLTCSSDAHPPASSYEWYNETGAQLHQGNVFRLPNVSRHHSGTLYCTAINEVGRGNSSLVQLNVLYAPEIKAISFCSSEGDMVKCVCIVESRPPSMVHFVLSDRVLPSTKVEKHDSVTIGTLQAELGSSAFVLCLANNTQGNANVTLFLPVNNAPVNVRVEHESAVKEGETVQLTCSSDAHPPASSYEWYNETGARLHQGNVFRLPNVSRHHSGTLYCTAINEVGRGNSSLVQLNVLYAPEIKAISFCSSEGDMVKCVCIVESRPPSMVHFVLSDRVLPSTKVEKHDSVTIGTLQAELGSSAFVLCLANNTQGNANVTLFLPVNNAPVNVRVEHESAVKEGETVQLTCSSDAHPPASSYEWYNETGARLHQGNVFRLPNVSRHHSGTLYCTAINEVGRGNSSLVQLNVLYAPEIKAISSCSSEGDMVKCVCIVESRPPSMVHFVLSDRVLPSTKVEKHDSVTIGTLQAELGSSAFVLCQANNTQGNANVTLFLPVNNAPVNVRVEHESALPVNSRMQSLYIIIAIGAGAILVILLTAVGVVKKCRGRSGEAPTSHMKTMHAEKDVELSQYAATKRKENYDDVHCPGIYANDPVYGNMEADDDAVYANM